MSGRHLYQICSTKHRAITRVEIHRWQELNCQCRRKRFTEFQRG